MKKTIVALLTTILATFGYAVVDKTMDARLADLESSVSSLVNVASSQRDEIESLHSIGKYYQKKYFITTSFIFPGTVTVYCEGKLQETRDVKDLLRHAFGITGSTANGLVEMYLNDILYCSYTVNFRAEEPYIVTNWYNEDYPEQTTHTAPGTPTTNFPGQLLNAFAG